MNYTTISDLLGPNCPPNSTKAPPPPPPLPPSLSRSTQKLPKAPALPPKFEVVSAKLSGLDDGFRAAADKAMLHTLKEFRPTFFFCYGSLMDTEVLQHVLNLDKPPQIETATIKNFGVKMWGIYPALIDVSGGMVSGTTWQVTDVNQFIILAQYETSAYTPCEVEIMRQDGETVHGKSFRWAGDPASSDLEEGSFSLDRYQMHFKSALFQINS